MTTARRTLIKGAAAMGALSAASSSVIAQPFLFSPSTELLPKGKKRRMGRSVSTYIAQQSKGKPMKPVIIDNLCYMLVNTEPLEAINVKFEYKMGAEGHLLQTITDDNFRRQELWQADLQWYGTMVKDLTGG